MKKTSKICLVMLAAAVSVAACAKDEKKKSPGYFGGPLCSELVTEAAPNELFTSSLVLTSAIQDAYPFGSTQPDNVQEVINFELGFYIKNEPAYANVPITAPADLYVSTLEVSRYDDDINGSVDREDFGVVYEVCSQMVDGDQVPGVIGNFAHMKSLSAELKALYDEAELALINGEVSPNESPVRCTGTVGGVGTCTFFVSVVQQETDSDFQLVIEEGTTFGTTASPGIDANLRDLRRTNFFLNPDRWTADTGHATGFKYGACTYEYFAEPYKTEYLRKIGANGVFRNLDDLGNPIVVEHPCGLLEADIHGDGNGAGYWMRASTSQLQMEDDMTIQETEEVLGGLLVLSENFLRPNTHLSISTNLMVLSSGGDPAFPMLVELEAYAPIGTTTNEPFRNIVPGTVYCYQGQGYLNNELFYYLLELTNVPEPTITIERVAAPCSALAQVDRVFTGNAIDFVR